jgi:hypothetical protein
MFRDIHALPQLFHTSKSFECLIWRAFSRPADGVKVFPAKRMELSLAGMMEVVDKKFRAAKIRHVFCL